MIKSGFLLLTAIALSLFLRCSSEGVPSNRNVISLSGSWSFIVDSLSRGMSENWGEKGVPENLLRTVSVPHSWNVEKGLERYWGKRVVSATN